MEPNKTKSLILLIPLALFASANCQQTTCESLKSHAESCGSAIGRYSSEAKSACSEYRQVYGTKAFDAFSECIINSDCADTTRQITCRQTHLPQSEESACERFTLWSIGCGLEPTTSGKDCGGYATGLQRHSFNQWVDCVTENGCPQQNDKRYQNCQLEIIPPPLDRRFNVCNKLRTWANICGPQAPEDSPIDFDLMSCLAQGQVFTDPSFDEYATCLLDIAASDKCTSNTDRVLCRLRLEVIDHSELSELCTQLVSFGLDCPGPITGNSPMGCGQLFSRFTPKSFQDYVTCVTGAQCDQNADFSSCLPLLRFTG